MKKLLFLLLTMVCGLWSVKSFSQSGISINNTGAGSDISAILDISSTFQGLLIPRMTTSQRDNIASPATSLLIFNITTNCFEAYVNSAWYSVSCPPCTVPSAPTPSTSTSTSTSIIWNWNTVDGASGYKWNTENNYINASDNGTDTFYTQTGLSGNTSYTLYVWAYNSCGNSEVTILTESTSVCNDICSQIQHTYGGTYVEQPLSVQQAVDGGFVIAGYTNSFGNGVGGQTSEVYLVKTDGSGNALWSKTFGGNGFDVAYNLQNTSDGGYIMTGYSTSFGTGANDYYLIKTDGDGNLQWNRNYAGAGSAFSVGQSSDGGYIMVGPSVSIVDKNINVIRTDGSGNVVWSEYIGGTATEYAYSVQPTSDGGFIIGGVTYKFGAGSNDLYLVKTDGDGNISWSKAFGGTGSDFGSCVQQTSDGGYIMTGYTMSFGAGSHDFILVKTDESGNLLWSKAYGGPGSDAAYYVQQTMDGGYIMAGPTSSFESGNRNYYLVKTDGSGNLQWSKTYGGAGMEAAWSAKQACDGGYLITGFTESFGAGNQDFYLVKTDEYGNAAGCNTTTPATVVTNITLIVNSPATIATPLTTNVTSPTLTVTSPTTKVSTPCSSCK